MFLEIKEIKTRKKEIFLLQR